MSVGWQRYWELLERGVVKQGTCRVHPVIGAIALGTLGAVAVSSSPVFAQITPDGTLGGENSIVTPNVDVRGLPAERIEGGAARGTNLFHSFSQFNVGNGQRVYFTNPTGIENILTRVTGNNISNIFGTLGVDGGANLFLLNPNGIIFGPNARLDIAGSFVASTANGVVFDNGFAFSATNPEAPPLLTINVPLGLQNGSIRPGATIANSGNLSVGKNLGLAADNLNLQGQLQAGGSLALFASDIVQVRDTATNPFVASAGGHLVIQGTRLVDIFALNHPESGFFSGGEMVLRSGNSVVGDARYSSGRSFRIERLDGNPGDLSSQKDPIIRSGGNVSFTNYFGTSLHILAGGSVTVPGIVAITAPETGTVGVDYLAENVILSDGTIVPINGRLRPTLDVRAGVNPANVGVPGVTGDNTDLFFSGFFNFFGFIFPIPETPTLSNTATSADITIGGIAMLGNNAADGLVFLSNQYRPNTSLPGGNIEVGAIVTTDNVSQVLNQLPADLSDLLDSFGLRDGFTGNGGDVIVDSRSNIALNSNLLANFGLNVGLINTASGTGDAGAITLLASDRISLANSFIFSDSLGAGRGGDITVQARSVSLTNGTLVSASTFGTGQGGNLTIVAPESVELVGSKVLAATTGDGNAGNLSITTGRLTVQDQAAVAALTFGDGDAGTLSIATNQFIVRNAVVATSTLGGPDFGLEPAIGRGGELIVNASDSVELTSTVNNGKIDLDVPIPGFKIQRISAPIGLFTSSQSLGDAGNLTITTGRLTVQGGAVASTSTYSSQGRGGNLTVNASQRVELIGTSGDPKIPIPSALLSDTGDSGNGGDVTITTPYLLLRDGAVVSTGSGRGEDLQEGRVSDNTGDGGDIFVTADLIELTGISSNLILRSAFQAGTASFGDAGDIRIVANRLLVRDGAVILAATLHQGDSGSITIDADSVEVVGTAPDTLPSGISTGTAGTGTGRDLNINTRTLSVRDGGLISAASLGQGNGGNLNVSASELVESVGTAPDGRPSGLSAGSGIEGVASIPLLQKFGIDPSRATGDSGTLTIATGRLSVRDGAEVSTATIGPGIGGNIQLRANSIDLSNGARLSAATSGSGRAGNILVQEADSIALSNSSISTAVNAGAVVNDTAGGGGNITLQTRQLLLGNNSEVAASTSGQGNAGSIFVQEADTVALSESSISTAVNTGAVGQGGKIDIQTGLLSLNNGAQVSAATSGQGNAGSILVREANAVSLDNSAISSAVNTGAVGEGGDVELQTRSLSLTNNAQVSAATSGTGTAGNISVRDADSVSLDNSAISSAVNAGAVGEGGDVDIQARSLSLTNNAQVSAATSGTGRAGKISVHDADSVSLDNSAISSAVNAGAVGEGGNVEIQARSLSLNNNAQVSAATSGTGRAGKISVRNADSVSLVNSSISSAVNAGAVGEGGNVELQARSLSMDNRAQISASTSGQGPAGNITVTANTVDATNGGQLLTSTTSSENAGNITMTVQDRVTLVGAGSGVFANTAPGSSGNGGSIALNAGTLRVQGEAGIAVGSQGTGEGGDISVQTNSLTLEDEAFISAKTASNTGGNINLGVQDLLLMRRGSEISTTAGTALAGGDGGNITIAAEFILGIPQENSDITANAFTGRGGNINITTQGIFGLEFRPRLTPLSDITASSEFGINGTVQINTLGIDPNRGLAQLPTDIVDATGLIDRRCAPSGGTAQNSSFTVTGRGGLPPNPNETLGEEGLLEDLGTSVAVRDRNQGQQSAVPVASANTSVKPLVEAQSWVIAPNGTVILTAQALSTTPQHPWQTSASCQNPSNSHEVLDVNLR